MIWRNEPPRCIDEGDRLTVWTGDKTDFWRKTHYGFIHDNGHFGYVEVDGDFSATVRFHAEYAELYDQAGLMVWLDDETWIKAGIEYTDGRQHLSVVATNGVSDWSVRPLDNPPEWVWLRLSRKGDAVKVEWSPDGNSYEMLRLAPFPAEKVGVGPMCCSPLRAGLKATFERCHVGLVIDPFLH